MTESLLFIHGKPGSGKSTCCRTTVENTPLLRGGIPLRHLSVGEHFRAIFAGERPSAHKEVIRELEEKSLSVGLPSHVLVHEVVMEFIRGLETPGVTLVDGFPKQPELIPLINGEIDAGRVSVLGCVVVDVSDASSIARQVGRTNNDTHTPYAESVAAERILQYQSVTEPVVDELLAKWGGTHISGEAAQAVTQEQFDVVFSQLCGYLL